MSLLPGIAVACHEAPMAEAGVFSADCAPFHQPSSLSAFSGQAVGQQALAGEWRMGLLSKYPANKWRASPRIVLYWTQI